MTTPEDVAGPIIVWKYNGYEGWGPTSYPTLLDALANDNSYGNERVFTFRIDLKAHVIEPASPNPVDIPRAARAVTESGEQLARGCGTVPPGESQQTLKK